MEQKKPSQKVVIIPTLIAAVAAGAIFFVTWQQGQRQRAIDDWVHEYTVNAMVLQNHPDTLQRFRDHFVPYYDQLGEKGLAEGQLELQQILNVNYLTDYIWTVKDPELQRYLQTEMAFIDGLVKAQNGKPGLCEQYFGNSAYYAQAQQVTGGRLFLDFMLASEKLFLSAQDGVEYKITPQHGNYLMAREAANSAFWSSFQYQHPNLNHEQLLRARDLFNPLVSCAGYAEHLRALLAMPSGFMSLNWRAAMEQDRPQFEAMRRLRGSE